MKLKYISLILALIMVISPMTACGGGHRDDPGNGGGYVKPDNVEQMTVVKVLNYDSGLGRTHITKTAQAFSEAVKDVSYEPGKKGVYIEMDSNASGTFGKELLGTMANSPYDMFFTANMTADMLQANGNVLDLTPYVKATNKDAKKISDFADSVSIYDRMYSDVRTNVTAKDDKIYSVPLFLATYNFYYDVELVEKKGLYIRKDSNDTKLNLTDKLSDACLGVDGKKGTYDDGLPETYAQFELWLNEISRSGCTPMHFYGPMSGWAFDNWICDFAGKDKMQACWSFDGTVMDDLIDTINPDGSITYLPPTAITVENGYLVQRQEGRYRALQMLRKFADNYNTTNKSWIHKNTFTENHKESQGTYIISKYDKRPIMLFAEGGYWQTEAAGVFQGLENRKGGRMDRKFAVLPVPKYHREDVGTPDKPAKSTVMIEDSGSMIVRKSTQSQSNFKAIMDFLMFYNQENMMAMQNREGSQPRPFNYDIEPIKDTMSFYEQSLYNLLHNSDIDLVFGSDPNDFTRANRDNLDRYTYILCSKYLPNSDDTSYRPIFTFHDYPDVTVEQYFYGLTDKFTYKANSKDAKSLWERLQDNVG